MNPCAITPRSTCFWSPFRRAAAWYFSDTRCSEDVLERSWQRLILTHLQERTHLGVLTGSPITDMKLTLMSGRAHLKHTEGGDFRQATYRAVRQGLMQAQSVLLEALLPLPSHPPQAQLGRAIGDLRAMSARFYPRAGGRPGRSHRHGSGCGSGRLCHNCGILYPGTRTAQLLARRLRPLPGPGAGGAVVGL